MTNKWNAILKEDEFLNVTVKHLTAKLDRATNKSNELKAWVNKQDCATNKKYAWILDAKEEPFLLKDGVDELNNELNLGAWKVD